MRRHAQNTFDDFTNPLTCQAPVSALPDSPINPIKMCAFFQSFVIQIDQGLIMSGDSGGPAFFKTDSGYSILGVASFGNLLDSFVGPPFSYYSGHANVTDPTVASFISDVLGQDTAIPEPASSLTIGLGLLMLAGFLRFRSTARR